MLFAISGQDNENICSNFDDSTKTPLDEIFCTALLLSMFLADRTFTSRFRIFSFGFEQAAFHAGGNHKSVRAKSQTNGSAGAACVRRTSTIKSFQQYQHFTCNEHVAGCAYGRTFAGKLPPEHSRQFAPFALWRA